MDVHAPPCPPLDPRKFRDPALTARGEARAMVAPGRLATLWFNTGSLCNLACRTCYMESSPRDRRLAYLTRAEVDRFLDEAVGLGTAQVGFTGGEPFMNPELPDMLDSVLGRGLRALVLTNAMRPMRKLGERLLALRTHGDRLVLRVSLDHYTRERHEAERGPRSWQPAIEGLRWLAASGFTLHVASRRQPDEAEPALRARFAALFAELGLAMDAADPVALTLFPEMDAAADVPEITAACWDILHRHPDELMCHSSRMVLRRRDAAAAAVVACTLLPYEPEFELGATLAEALRPVSLNHPHCARFCMLGGASCSAG
jgi:uncharacterized Fe-S cluster-containing radical SAM superfamily protein